jgi:DNA-binding LacI/PurR family transcriptional regulator
MDVSDEDYIREFSARGFPRVILNDKLTHCSWVAVDDRHGMFRLLDLLEGLGHKRIAYRCNHRGYHLQSHSSLVDRFEAYSEWMTERGIPLSTDHSIKMSDDAFLDSIRSLGCTAVVCYDEKNALSLYRTCGEVGIRIPEDLSLVGFDKPVNYALLPKITSMWQPAKEMGEIAAELLLAQMNGTLKSPGHHLLKLHYHEGETLAPPKSP